MAGVWKDDFLPLLPLGWHPMDVAAVRRLCVLRFPDSITRPGIMDGLEQVIARLNQSGLHLEVWIDGSFATQKLNPEDSDVAVKFSGEEFDAATNTQKLVLQWAGGDGPRNDHRCDCYPFPEYAVGHPLYENGQWRRAYWMTKFGHDRAEQPKGLVIVRLPFLLI
jgi:hypothetical protein